MFRDFKEKMNSEFEKAKVKIATQAQNLANNGTLAIGDKLLNPGTGTIKRSDSLTSNDSRILTETSQTSDTSKYSEPGFSLVDLDDDQSSRPTTSTSTPLSIQQVLTKRGNDADSFFKTKFITNIVSNFVPQSDIESEYESESGSKNLENISKEQLLALCHRLKARSTKYREKWSDMVKVYRDTITERDKLKNVLSETQDVAIRRVNELKEQCNLEQEAKRHLEENLQMLLEEKEEQVKALQTKLDVINTGDLISLADDKKSEYTDRIASLELLLTKSNESLKSNKEKVDVLTKENEDLAKFKDIADKLEKEIEHVRKLKDSASTSFTEARQKLHDELESRNIIIKELKDQLERNKNDVKKRTNELKNRMDTIKNLKDKIITLENTSEAEKANILEEISRSKAAAINLIKEEYEKKLQSTTEELKVRIGNLTEENVLLKEQENNDKTSLLDEQRKQVEETYRQNETLRKEVEKCNQQLAQTIEELNRTQTEREQAQQSLQQILDQNEDKTKQFQTKIDKLTDRIEELNHLKEEFEVAKTLLEEAKSKTIEATNELELVRSQFEETKRIILELSTEKENAEKALKEEIGKRQAESYDQSQSHKEVQNQVRTFEENLKEKCTRIAQLEESLILKDSEIIELSKTKSELENEVENLKKTVESFDASIDERLKMAKDEQEKNLKMLADSKSALVKLREECHRLQAQIEAIGSENRELTAEKTKLSNELSSLDSDLINFKNRLIQIFYSSYADSEVNQISSLEYSEFLNKIEIEYRNTVEQNQKLAEKIEILEKELDVLTVKTEKLVTQEKSKHEFDLDSVREVNENLAKEIKTLRSAVAQQRELETLLDERKVEVDTYKEKNESLLEELEALRGDLSSTREVVKAKEHAIQLKEDQIYGLTSQIEFKENEMKKLATNLSEADDVNEKQKELVEELDRVRKECDQHRQQAQSAGFKNEEMGREVEELNKQNSIYLEEITKIKSNAKGILESKQKLQDKLKSSESNLSNLKQEYQSLINLKNQREVDQVNLEKTKHDYKIKENNLLAKINELETQIAKHNSKEEQVKNLAIELKNSQELYSELDLKLKEKDSLEQDLRTEIISLEEKLKNSQHNDRDLQEEVKTNEKASKNMKEQIHKHLVEIKDLKNEINEMKSKHEETVDKLYKQLEVRESQLDESLLNANSQHHSTNQELLRSKADLSKLNIKLEELISLNRDLELKLSAQSQESGENSRQAIEKYEYQIETLQTQLEQRKQEIAFKMDQFDDQENRLINEYKAKTSQLENDVAEKNFALEEVHEYYQQRLKAKENELKLLHEQLTSTDENNYQIDALQTSLLQYHEENLRLKEALKTRKEMDNGTMGNTDVDNCAILGVHLPQPTEYEYLRNILLEFMMGREPVTLAKVIAAVMRFNNEETQQIIRKQETLHTQPVGVAKRKT